MIFLVQESQNVQFIFKFRFKKKKKEYTEEDTMLL